MTDQTPPEVAIVSALGINPALVQAGSLKILYDGQPDPIITFTLIQRVPMADLAKAMGAAVTDSVEEVKVTEVSEEIHRPMLVRDLDDPVIQREIKAKVDAELQRLATEDQS